MHGAGSMPFDAQDVVLTSVAFVLLKLVACKDDSTSSHQPVSRHFCEDGSGCDAGLQRVTTNDRGVREIKPKVVSTIDEEEGGACFCCEHCESTVHCLLCGREDAFSFDHIVRDNADSPCAVGDQPSVGFLAPLGRKTFTICNQAIWFLSSSEW